MCTYSIEDLKVLQDIAEDIMDTEKNPPFSDRILDDLKNKKGSVDEIIKYGIAEYLCGGITYEFLLYQNYINIGADALVYDTPLEELPLYLNCTGDEKVKKVLSMWRLKIGK